MKKTTFIILAAILLLNACASPPPATPPSTLIPLPPTQTPLPPTPDLDDILFSEVSEKYTLVRDNNERFHLQDEDENAVPEISIDIKGNVFFGEGDIPVTLLEEDKSLTLITKDDETLIFNGEKWVELIKNLPEGLPKGYIYNNPNEDRENLIGATITDAEGKPIYVYVETANGEWIKDYERIFNLSDYENNQLTMEDISGKHIETFFEAILKSEFQEKTDWNKVKDWPFTAAGGYFKYWADSTKNVVKFPDPETAPFIKGTGFCGELVVGKNRYLYILFALRDVDNQGIEYVNLAAPLQKDGIPLTEVEINDMIRILEEEMNFFIIGFDATPLDATQEDPLFSPQVNEARGLMSEIIGHIARTNITGDVSRISELNHLIFLTQGIEFSEDDWGGVFTNSLK